MLKAAKLLSEQGIACDVFSVTSWSELAREQKFVGQQLMASKGPIIAATDYVRALPESVRAYVPAGRSYTTLGTDGFGRSDTRAALRGFFGVDAAHIVKAALKAL